VNGEEAIQSILDRVAEKQTKNGSMTLTLDSLAGILRSALTPLAASKYEPGFPKKMSRSWPYWDVSVPAMPSVESRFVDTAEEAQALLAQGWKEERSN
jgi:hypothetical protein